MIVKVYEVTYIIYSTIQQPVIYIGCNKSISVTLVLYRGCLWCGKIWSYNWRAGCRRTWHYYRPWANSRRKYWRVSWQQYGSSKSKPRNCLREDYPHLWLPKAEKVPTEDFYTMTYLHYTIVMDTIKVTIFTHQYCEVWSLYTGQHIGWKCALHLWNSLYVDLSLCFLSQYRSWKSEKKCKSEVFDSHCKLQHPW